MEGEDWNEDPQDAVYGYSSDEGFDRDDYGESERNSNDSEDDSILEISKALHKPVELEQEWFEQ